MPKIVDHQAYRLELAEKAIKVFTLHGYHGLGMRGIAEAIGVSKSALYHYFSSKKELFSVCTELITQPHSLYGVAKDEQVPRDKVEATTALLTTLDKRFQGELILLLDYIKGMNAQDVAQDPLLIKAQRRFLTELSSLVGDEQAEKAYALMMGSLLLRVINGQQTRIEDVAHWILALKHNEK